MQPLRRVADQGHSLACHLRRTHQLQRISAASAHPQETTDPPTEGLLQSGKILRIRQREHTLCVRRRQGPHDPPSAAHHRQHRKRPLWREALVGRALGRLRGEHMRHHGDLPIVLLARREPGSSAQLRTGTISRHSEPRPQRQAAGVGVQLDAVLMDRHGGAAGRHPRFERGQGREPRP